ncbi:MAG: alkyl hydroperoxide reductase [Phycisphaerae bacterium]|nr:alkyl hydroperoxide reductase [Phycisphaerae bacterium]|tara:strand:- start:174 stop:560 length:387 start_codon:yes stop_codon:yes gene_type:complete
MRHALTLAGLYNLLFGAWVVIWPSSIFNWLGMEPPTYLFLWQCIGMIVGVYGIGYLVAAGDPLRHWPIVLVGFLGKIFGPIGFLQTAMMGDIPWSFGFVIIFNDLIWWIPFGAILFNAWRSRPQSAAV